MLLKNIFFLGLLSTPLFGQSSLHPEAASGWDEKKPVYAEKMMVVSANPYASEEGLKILQKGGSAIDAAIAMQMVLGLVEPQSSGIGGGAFLLYFRKKDGKVIVYDGRESAPKNVDNITDTHLGGTAVATPGLLKMLEQAHQDEGKLAWKMLFNRAIELSEKGYPISPRLNQLISKTKNLDDFPEAKDFFFQKRDGSPKPAKTFINNPDLAFSYRTIASEGTTPFYEGVIGEAIVKAVQKTPINPGTLTLEDLSTYTALKQEPVRFSYKNYDFATAPLPSRGGVGISQIFALLSTKDLSSYNLGSVPFIDLFCKASRLGPGEKKSKSATSQICVVDEEGNVVSMTTSIGSAFGSKLIVKGFFLNNEMDDFTEASDNHIGPLKRPMSAMTPTLVFEKQSKTPLMTIGSAGGSAIVDYVAQALVGVLEFKMDIQEAISFPHYVSADGGIILEEGTELEKDLEELEALGNTVSIAPLTSGTAGIWIESDELVGGVDPRREGIVLGE